MYRVTVTIEGISPLSQSHQHYTPFLDGESHDAYEQRTWRFKCNCDEAGNVFVPAMAMKQAMDTAAKRLAIPDPDNKRANLTKYVVSDVICEANLPIGIHRDKMPMVTINANSDGVRGSGKRVRRNLPQTPTWGGKTSFIVTEEKITHPIFEKILATAGQSVGVGQFRPEKGGLNGRFVVKNVKYEQL